MVIESAHCSAEVATGSLEPHGKVQQCDAGRASYDRLEMFQATAADVTVGG
jgi:hypothetical protein